MCVCVGGGNPESQLPKPKTYSALLVSTWQHPIVGIKQMPKKEKFQNVDGLPAEVFPDRRREVLPACKDLQKL